MICSNLTDRMNKGRVCTLLLLMAAAGIFTACGKEQQTENEQYGTIQEESREAGTSQTISDQFGEGQSIDDIEATTDNNEGAAGTAVDEADITKNAQTDELKNRFGENCISEQTFEVELSEYEGKVWFVPYAPAEDGQALDMQIIQDGEILTRIYTDVPESLEGQPFTSLDAVSFFDVNYDGCTDIVVIETYGDASFAEIYYGFANDGSDYVSSFISYDSFSERITKRVGNLTISEIRKFLSDGKKNGEFNDYKEAYRAIVRWSEVAFDSELTYDLIYFDDDDIPELVFGYKGYWVSMYTYYDGKACMLMDHWAYGAMGNAGYEYIPRGNRLGNYNNDYAGLICYTTYMTISEQHALDVVTVITTYNFDDVNGNGMPDEDEMDSAGSYGAIYVGGEEITYEQYAEYDAGEYEYIVGSMNLEELTDTLAQTN